MAARSPLASPQRRNPPARRAMRSSVSRQVRRAVAEDGRDSVGSGLRRALQPWVRCIRCPPPVAVLRCRAGDRQGAERFFCRQDRRIAPRPAQVRGVRFMDGSGGSGCKPSTAGQAPRLRRPRQFRCRWGAARRVIPGQAEIPHIHGPGCAGTTMRVTTGHSEVLSPGPCSQ